MKQMTCELCGSTDLVKQDGMFVCQSCGCKYTLEEARKLMGTDNAPAEQPAAASTTVKVDTSEKLTKLYQIARRARDDNNSENAAKYYDLILQEDPLSWEASFYTVYYQAMQTNIAGIEGAAHRVHNCLGSVLGLILEHVPQEGQLLAAGEVAVRVSTLSTMLANAAKSHYDNTDASIRDKYTQEYIDRVCAARDTVYDLGDMIEKSFSGDKAHEMAASLWKIGISLHKSILPRLADQQGNNRTIDRYAEKVGRYDPAYQDSRKAEKVKAKIADIDRQIAGLNTTGAYKFGCGGTFFLCIGIVALIFGFMFQSLEDSTGTLLLVCGAICIVGGLLVGFKNKPSKATIDANIQKAEELRKLRDELQKDVDDLTKK